MAFGGCTCFRPGRRCTYWGGPITGYRLRYVGSFLWLNDDGSDVSTDKILSKSRTLPGGVLNIVRNLSEDPVSDVRSFVSHILPQDLRPPTELAYGHVSGSSASMATFSRPPPKREPRTLVTGISDMKISNTFHARRFMVRTHISLVR